MIVMDELWYLMMIAVDIMMTLKRSHHTDKIWMSLTMTSCRDVMVFGKVRNGWDSGKHPAKAVTQISSFSCCFQL